MKRWLVEENGNPGNYVTVEASHKPRGAVGLSPEGERDEWIKVVEVQSDEGLVKVVTIDEALKSQIKAKLDVKEASDTADRIVSAPTAPEIAGVLLLGSPEEVDKLRQRSLFFDFSRYCRERYMSEGKYAAIVLVDGAHVIQEYPFGTKPSNFVAMAPAGFKPGDEEFLTKRAGGGFDIDWDGRLAKFKALEKSAQEARSKDEWNDSSVFTRFKNSYFGS